MESEVEGDADQQDDDDLDKDRLDINGSGIHPWQNTLSSIVLNVRIS